MSPLQVTCSDWTLACLLIAQCRPLEAIDGKSSTEGCLLTMAFDSLEIKWKFRSNRSKDHFYTIFVRLKAVVRPLENTINRQKCILKNGNVFLLNCKRGPSAYLEEACFGFTRVGRPIGVRVAMWASDGRRFRLGESFLFNHSLDLQERDRQ